MAYERKEGVQDTFQISDLPTGKLELPSIGMGHTMGKVGLLPETDT